MRSSRLSCALLLSLVLLLSITPRRSAAQSVTLSPGELSPGSVALIQLELPSGATPEGEWLGRRLSFFPSRSGHGWLALAGVDVETPAGPSTLRILWRGAAAGSLERLVTIQPAHYRTSALTVAPRFTEPAPEEVERIQAEVALKKQIFASSAPAPLWSGRFLRPLASPATDSFGARRTFNGKVASIHKGMDFRAPAGTPVLASNAGRIVLARTLYFEGGCVVVDHGLGFFTLSMHLSRIDVQEGQSVAPGDRLGLSGATGRVTGPHLHWAVRWQDSYLDPARLLEMPLPATH